MPIATTRRGMPLPENEPLHPRLAQSGELLRAMHPVSSRADHGAQFLHLGRNESFDRVLVEAMNEGAAILRDEGTILYCNGRLSAMLKAPPDRIMGAPFFRFIAPEDVDSVARSLRQCRTGNCSVETCFHWEGVTTGPVKLSLSPMRIQGLTGICVVVTDLTDRKRTEALANLSLTDELTGLSNRRGFFTLAQSQLTLARRLHTEVALVFLDLDDFKTINDTFGHGNGDRALVDFAGLLKNTYRESDIIARLGGDEFAVLAAGTPEMSMLTLDDRLQKNLNAFNAAGHRPYQLRMSVGMVRCDYENPLPVPDLLALADAAMYEQKRGKHKHSANLVA